jgi:hypothetical protein
MVSYERDPRNFLDASAAPIGARAVADHVSEAPDRIRRLAVDRAEDRFERVPIAVDV